LIRKNETAFDPYGCQKVQHVHPGIFSVIRESKNERIASYTNVTNQTITIKITSGLDLISEQFIESELTIEAYGIVWVKEEVN